MFGEAWFVVLHGVPLAATLPQSTCTAVQLRVFCLRCRTFASMRSTRRQITNFSKNFSRGDWVYKKIFV